MPQAKGSAVQLLCYKEATFNTIPGATTNSVSFPYNPPLKPGVERSLNFPKTMRNSRSPVMPYQGNLKVGLSVPIPMDIRYIGYWLQATLGAPVSVQDAAKALVNGQPAVNVGGGVTGLPCTNHGFVQGETITIANTTNYNGAKVVAAGSTANQVNITATYVAENMGASSTARGTRYTHTFKMSAPGTGLYSYVMQPGFTDITQYQTLTGMKVDKFGFKAGGENELTATVDMIGANESTTAPVLTATPLNIGFLRLSNFMATIQEGGASIATVKAFELNINNNLDGDLSNCCLGSGGILPSLPEQIAQVNGSIEAQFVDWTLYNKAVNGTESSLQILFTYTPFPYTLTFNVNELNYKRQSPGIDTPGGLWIPLSYEAFYDNHADQSAVTAILYNDVASYIWT